MRGQFPRSLDVSNVITLGPTDIRPRFGLFDFGRELGSSVARGSTECTLGSQRSWQCDIATFAGAEEGEYFNP